MELNEWNSRGYHHKLLIGRDFNVGAQKWDERKYYEP